MLGHHQALVVLQGGAVTIWLAGEALVLVVALQDNRQRKVRDHEGGVKKQAKVTMEQRGDFQRQCHALQLSTAGNMWVVAESGCIWVSLCHKEQQ
jgi:shikimate kinase